VAGWRSEIQAALAVSGSSQICSSRPFQEVRVKIRLEVPKALFLQLFNTAPWTSTQPSPAIATSAAALELPADIQHAPFVALPHGPQLSPATNWGTDGAVIGIILAVLVGLTPLLAAINIILQSVF